ncbi:MAG: hypothetical protein ACTSYI_01875 [Promethearchaeota archaeon]
MKEKQEGLQGFSDTGQIDFSAVLLNQFPLALEFMGAGEKMWVRNGKSGKLIDYGFKTDGKLIEQLLMYFPTISVALDATVHTWYDTNGAHVGKDNPSITPIQFNALLTAMALVYHPAIRPYIEAARSNIFTNPEIMGDPLKIALYMLQCDVPMPAIDWMTGETLKNKDGTEIMQPFYQLCGFSSLHTAQIVQDRFGVNINADFTLNEYTTVRLQTWWERRNLLIACLQAGNSAPGAGTTIQPAFDLFTNPM